MKGIVEGRGAAGVLSVQSPPTGIESAQTVVPFAVMQASGQAQAEVPVDKSQASPMRR